MNEEEKYLFDLRGYLVVKNALNKEQVESLSRIIDNKLNSSAEKSCIPKEERKLKAGSDRTWLVSEDDIAWTSPSLLEWGGPFIELIDIPTITPYLETLLGINYRLDHDYLLIANKETSRPLFLHGGGQGAGGINDIVGPTDGGQCYYRYKNGRFFNGLIVVAFELNTVLPEDGGFACIAGSHKSNFALPESCAPIVKNSSVQAPSLTDPYSNRAPGLKSSEIPDYVDRISASSGDAIIFTEACQHGTLPWNVNSKRERRTLFYKYCPHAVAWSPCYYNSDHYKGLTENQINMLMPPSAFGPDASTSAIWRKAQAEQAELVRLRSKGNN